MTQITEITTATGDPVTLKTNSAGRRFAWAIRGDGVETKIKDFVPGDSKKESEADTLARLVDFACAQKWDVEQYEVDESAQAGDAGQDAVAVVESFKGEIENSVSESAIAEDGTSDIGNESDTESDEAEPAPAPTTSPEPTFTAEASRKRLLQEIISTARREIFSVGISCTVEKVTVDGESVTVKFGSSHVADFTRVMHYMKESIFLFIEPAQGNLKFDADQADALAEQIELPLAMTLDGPCPAKPESLKIVDAEVAEHMAAAAADGDVEIGGVAADGDLEGANAQAGDSE